MLNLFKSGWILIDNVFIVYQLGKKIRKRFQKYHSCLVIVIIVEWIYSQRIKIIIKT